MTIERLKEFYRTASTVVGHQTPDRFHSELMDRLAKLLRAREVTKEMYDRMFEDLEPKFLLASEGSEVPILENLTGTLVMLAKEAAALHVLVCQLQSGRGLLKKVASSKSTPKPRQAASDTFTLKTSHQYEAQVSESRPGAPPPGIRWW